MVELFSTLSDVDCSARSTAGDSAASSAGDDGRPDDCICIVGEFAMFILDDEICIFVSFLSS